MRCPKCPSAPLQPTETRPGLELDSCPGCAGMWLDKSELYHFVKDAKALHGQFVDAYKAMGKTSYACPRCEKPLLRAVFPAGRLEFEACPSCGGTWFDAGEVARLNEHLDALAKGIGSGAAPSRPVSEPWTPDHEVRPGGAGLAFSAAALLIAACAGVAALAGALLRRAFPQLF